MKFSLSELLTEVTVDSLIWAFILIAIVVGIVASQKNKIQKNLNKWRKCKNDEEDFHSLVYTLNDTLKNLSEEVRQNQQNRDKELLQYRDDSKKIRDEMYKVINEQSKKIEKLTEITLEIQEKNSKTKRAEIKEKIERIYRECHPNMKCTDMAFETLQDLIEEYEEHGGLNSFVHTTVEKEMYEWEIVDSVSS